MKRSTDRILTTHVGSLVRPPEVLEDILLTVAGHPVDKNVFDAKVQRGVAEVVRQSSRHRHRHPQRRRILQAHILQLCVGAFGRSGPDATEAKPYTYAKLTEEFPGFMKQYNAMYTIMWMPPSIPQETIRAAMAAPPDVHSVVGPISYQGQALVQRDISNFKTALNGLSFVEAFMPSATPSRADIDTDQIYPTESAYLYALADAMHEEYKAIVDAGFVVQLDLGLPARNQVLPNNPNPDWKDLRRASEMQIEAYNHALRGIPEDRVRYHLCWGSMNTPHTTDVPLKDIIDLILRINAQAYSIEAANPRHEHEWMVWKDVKLPDGKILIPGVISHQTNVVEHPELVAMRIKNYASVVGRENVIASTDCGFAQGWSMIRVHQEVQWAKLAALVEGAKLASRDLWK